MWKNWTKKRFLCLKRNQFFLNQINANAINITANLAVDSKIYFFHGFLIKYAHFFFDNFINLKHRLFWGAHQFSNVCKSNNNFWLLVNKYVLCFSISFFTCNRSSPSFFFLKKTIDFQSLRISISNFFLFFFLYRLKRQAPKCHIQASTVDCN